MHQHEPRHNTFATVGSASQATRFDDQIASAPCLSGLALQSHMHSVPHRRGVFADDSHAASRARCPDSLRARATAAAYHHMPPAVVPPRPRRPVLPSVSPCVVSDDSCFSFVGRLTKDNFIHLVATDLDHRAEINNDYVRLPTFSEAESVYFSVSRPEIPTKDYIRRLVTYTQCSPAAFVVMLIYLDRIAHQNPRLLVTPYNMHRLLVTALTLACKVLDDRCFSNVHYAKVGGIPTAKEMNRLELQFLKYIDYRLHVDVKQYAEKLQALELQPSPTSPVSVHFDGSQGLTASSRDTTVDEIRSMVSVHSATSSADVRYRPMMDMTATSNMHPTAMEQWHASRTGPPPVMKRGRRRRTVDHDMPTIRNYPTP